jgi:hypothetical protein
VRLFGGDFANSLDVLAVEVLAVDALEVVDEDVEYLLLVGTVPHKLPHDVPAFVLRTDVRENIVDEIGFSVLF